MKQTLSTSYAKPHTWKDLPAERKFRLLCLRLKRLRTWLKRFQMRGPDSFAAEMLNAHVRLMTQEFERYRKMGVSVPRSFEKQTDQWLESTHQLSTRVRAKKFH